MQDRNAATLGDVLARMFWMMLGPILLAVFTYLIIKTGNGWMTRMDVAYLGILAGILLARWLEFRGGNPRTAEGEPATPAHLRRYIIAVSLLGVAIWIVANLLGNHWLAGE